MRRAAEYKPVPEAVLRRLALYHCLLTDWLLAGKRGSVTSRELATALGLSEVTVRSDLSFLRNEVGVPGVGYKVDTLRHTLEEFLGLPPFAPVAFAGSSKVVSSLFSIFSAERFGFTTAAFFSEDPSDQGVAVNGRDVHSIDDIPRILGALKVKVAVVATQSAWVQHTVNKLAEAGVKGIMILTPAAAVDAPEGVTIRQLRIPCDLKALFFHASLSEDTDDDSFEKAL